jgi:small basic protein (TIGR04137 family)
MSQHNSFKATTGGGGKKNRTVLKRFERVDLLRKRGEWKDGDRVVGIKKTKPAE